MRHKLRLTAGEKLKIWFDLCDFSYHLMSKALSKSRLNKRLKKMRKEHLQNNLRILQKLKKVGI